MKILVIPFLITAIAISGACGETASNVLPQRDSTDIDISGTGGRSDTAGNNSSENAASVPVSPAAADTGKISGTWYLVAALPSDTAAGKVPMITFDEAGSGFTGHTGCNNMRGTYSLADRALKINEQIITTKMACPGYNEDAFLKNLPKANAYRFENGMLILLSDQTELSRWTRKPIKQTIKTA